MPDINPDDILRARLGPPPLDALAAAMADFPDMLAVAFVVQLKDETFVCGSAGCTTLETIGMFDWAAHTVIKAVPDADIQGGRG